MKKVIWKFPVQMGENFTLNMPQGAQILSVQVQWDVPQLWALVDPLAPQAPREFFVIGTGWTEDFGDLAYIDTFQFHGGTYVFHLFERITPAKVVNDGEILHPQPAAIEALP